MWVIVYCNEGMESGYVYLKRALADHEIMDERTFATQVASSLDQTLDASDGYILNCCGDLRVEFMEHEPSVIGERYQGSTVIWSGESFYFERG